MENSAVPALSTEFLDTFSPIFGLAVICGTHAQLDVPLTQTLITLAQNGHHIAVIVANNHFEADEIARTVPQAQLKVARGETPHQVRHLVQRLLDTHTGYSVAVVIGLLEPFYDEQVKWQLARQLLTDTLALLNELARSLRVLVLITPAPTPTRPYLVAQLTQAAADYTELPTPAQPKQLPKGRLF